MSKTEASAISRIAGVYPTEILAAGAHTGKSIYALILGSGASISVCTGTDPNGDAYDFVAQKNWDAAPADVLLVAGENYKVTAITTSGGITVAY